MSLSESSANIAQVIGQQKSYSQQSGLLISSEYRAEQERLHESGVYGTASIAYAPMVAEIINRMEVTHLLDYGCGAQTNLAKSLKGIKHRLTYQAYDPGVPRFSKPPLPAQLVTCIDVLEHIEPEYIDRVLDELAKLTEAILFATVDTGPALKTLSDGRNAHVLQRPIDWWFPKLQARFEVQTLQRTSEHSFLFIGYSKPLLERLDGTPIT